jgi:hypothetical protein
VTHGASGRVGTLMIGGRKKLLRHLAIVAAALFLVVAIGHAGSHAADNSAESGASCAFCQNTATTTSAPVIVVASAVFIETLELPASVPIPAPLPRAHGSRGPPA